jgi:hypothetical protein
MILHFTVAEPPFFWDIVGDLFGVNDVLIWLEGRLSGEEGKCLKRIIFIRVNNKWDRRDIRASRYQFGANKMLPKVESLVRIDSLHQVPV